MNCPKCAGEMIDQRATKSNPKMPDFKCADPTCLNEKGYQTGVWLKTRAAAPHDPATGEVKTRAAGPGKPRIAPSPGARADLIAAWKDCFDQVYEHTNGKVEDGAMMAGVNSLFIAVSRLITNG